MLIEGSHDDARSYLSTLDVYVCLRDSKVSHWRASSDLAGLPIVAADVGSVSEAIRDRETGLLVPPEDPVALASAILRLLDDRRLAARLGERAHAVATEQFTAERIARAYETSTKRSPSLAALGQEAVQLDEGRRRRQRRVPRLECRPPGYPRSRRSFQSFSIDAAAEASSVSP